MAGAVPDGETGAAAKHVLLRAGSAGDADGANDGDAVENRHCAAHRHNAAAMRNYQAA